MKKWLKGLLAVWLLLSMLLPGVALGTLDCGNHVWGEWDQTRDPTCTAKGLKIRYCQNCMTYDEAEIPALGHDYTEWEVLRNPTCQEVGAQQRICRRCQDAQRETIPKTDHQYGNWTTSKEPTCTEAGSRVRYCTFCQNPQTEALPAKGHTTAERVTKQATCADAGTQETYCTVCGTVTKTTSLKATGNHTYGDWVVTQEATCKQNGTKARTCSVCGKKETETISKTTAHQYGDWVVTTPASCTSAGVRTKTCSICGIKQTETLPKLEHSFGEWTVQKAATCTKDGKDRRVCKECGASQHRVVKKLGHSYSDWEIIEEATDHSKGKRSAACDLCGKKTTESFYPEGTLYKGGDNPAETVKNVQKALADLGLYKGKISGKYDNATANAVSKFEKNYLGMKGDGIGWPKVIHGLLPGGIGGGFDGPNSSDTSNVKLLLDVEQVSPKKDFYASGDEITFKWTLTNKSKKDDALSVRMYHYKGMKADKKKDTEIGQPETLIPDEKFSGTFVYKVTDDDALAGYFTVGFIGRCKFKKKDSESNKVWFNYSAAGMGGTSSSGWTPPSEQQLAVSKKVENEPANHYFFVKGETIQYTISVANTSSVDVDNVLLTDLLFPGLDVGSFSIKAGDIRFFSVSYKVKATDIPAGEIVNTAIATYTGADGKLKSAKASAKAPVDLNTNSLYLYKTAVSTPANGMFYLPGEVITYDITVVNPTDKTFTDVRLYDELNTDPKEPIKKIGTMKPYTVKTVTFKHHTSKFEAKVGKVINVARVTYVNPKKAKLQESSNVCIVPAGLENSNGVIVKKVIISKPENGKYYEDAEEIRYMIEVTNNTVQDIVDLDVRDSLAPVDANGFRTIYENETLKAGETKSYPFSFLVGPADVENTYVTNIGSAYWTIDGTDYFETYSEPVYAPTAEVAVPRVPKPVSLDGAACENPLTAVGDGVAEHDVTECGDHTGTAADARQLADSGDYGQARSLWDGEIDGLYGEWVENADAEGARNAEDEKAAYEFQMNALEASLSLICDEEEVQAVMIEERMNKCVRLCYELHSAPETRSDSLSGEHTAASGAKSSGECRHEATYLANGSAHVVDGQCETHKQTMQLTNSLLDGAADDEERLVAWTRAQGNWLLQLNSMYDKWYLASDETQRAKIAADRISFDRLIEARRKTLADLYPDDPATAAEVLANMIMERTELVCRMLHEAGILKD